MSLRLLNRSFALFGVGFVASLVCMSPAAALTVTFTETATGVVASRDGFARDQVSGETISLSKQDGFGETGSPNKYIFNLLEYAGGPISDQVIVFAIPSSEGLAPNYPGPRLQFSSDPAVFDLGSPDNAIVETGLVQHIGSYANMFGLTIDINVSSNEATTTPLPAALPLFAGGLGVIALLTRRRKQKAAALAAA